MMSNLFKILLSYYYWKKLSFPSNCHTEVKLGVPYLFSGGAFVFPVDLLGEIVSYPNIFYLLGIVHKAVGRNL